MNNELGRQEVISSGSSTENIQGEISLFRPRRPKIYFNIMPVSITNDSALHTTMIKYLKDKRYKLLILYISERKRCQNIDITLTTTEYIMIGGRKLICGSKTIIDHIILL